MESPNIKVTTIDYYHRDQFMNVKVGLLPKKLNKNRVLFDNPKLACPHINLNVEVPDHGAGELHMESLLEYLRQKSSFLGNYKPHFVTNKQLLKCVAASDYETIEVEAVKIDGVIYLLKTYEGFAANPNYGKSFEHFMTKKTENEGIGADGTVRKAVFSAAIGGSRGSVPWKVLYSGEIDAIDEASNHYELKALSGGVNDHFWKNRSCSFYWQSFFSNVKTIVVGSRTGKYPNDYKTKPPLNLPELSLYEMETVKVEEMPINAAKAANNPKNKMYKEEPLPRNADWTVDKCQLQLMNFLHYINTVLRNNGDCAILSKTRSAENWECRMLSKEMAWFHEFVVDRLTKPPPDEKVPRTTVKRLEPMELISRRMPSSSDESVIHAVSNTNSSAIGPLKIEEPIKAREFADNSSQTESTAHPIDLSTIPGSIQTQPKSKIVFNAPFDEELTYPVKITNPSESAIGFFIRVKKSEGTEIIVTPSSGVLGSKESVRCVVILNGKSMDSAENRLIIEWRNVEAGSKVDMASLGGDGLFWRKTLMIEYND
ncbi:hypothetical protein CAEBREN_09687 [Caenorhabditis brenneri]|uniref:Decapping nuclease n=1 Tax=Caenorhabditis brenneri TaxID=135651 RepID=G0NTR0_CAEBE|nr:hypothetical protein CAEBREN_09687 [Caenorhabditis brenneri]